MKRKLTRLLIIGGLLAIGSFTALAQKPGPEAKPQKPGPSELKVPTDGTFKVLAPKIATGRVVKGAPYSATATTETIQTLSDGNQIIRKNQSKLYRDSEGRTRIEQTLETIGKWTADGQAQQSIFINDPVAGVSYSVDPRTRIAEKVIKVSKKPAAGAKGETLTINGKPATQAEFEAALEKKRQAQEEMPTPKGGKPKPTMSPEEIKQLKLAAATSPDAKRANVGEKQPLGKQVIEGVEAEGVRVTITIPAGEIGNTLPIEIVDETWYSPELQLAVLTKHRDPRSGETTYRLTNISRNEPDRSLFEIPADHAGKENKMPPKGKPPIKEEQ